MYLQRVILSMGVIATATMLTGCTSEPAMPHVEMQVATHSTATYEVWVNDDTGMTRLDALLASGDRTAADVVASERYRIVVDTVTSRGKTGDQLDRHGVCRIETKRQPTNFLIIVADDGCHLTYKN